MIHRKPITQDDLYKFSILQCELEAIRSFDPEKSLEWLPSRLLTSWEHGSPFYFARAAIQCIHDCGLKEPKQCTRLLEYNYCSLERNEFKQWEHTNLGKTFVIKHWWHKMPLHFLDTLVYWSIETRRTFDEWQDMMTDILATGADIFSLINARHVRRIVEGFRPRNATATKVLCFLIQRFQGEPETLLSKLGFCDGHLIINLLAARPEWMDIKSHMSFVQCIVGDCLANSYLRQLRHLELLLGLNEKAKYWPDNTLPSLLDDEDLIARCNSFDGLMVVSMPHINEHLYGFCQIGQQLIQPIQAPVVHSLLASGIEVLSGWSFEHDPHDDQGRSVGIFVQNNLSKMLNIWAKKYKFLRGSARYWLQVFTNLSASISASQKPILEDLILLCIFDRSQRACDSLDQESWYMDSVKKLLKKALGFIGPRTIVAALSALLSEFDTLAMALWWIEVTKEYVDWNSAFESFAQEEWDRWSALRKMMFSTRVRYDLYDEQVCVMPITPHGIKNASFPWAFYQRPRAYRQKHPSCLIPKSYSSFLYGCRTLHQSIQVGRALACKKQQRQRGTTCAFVPGKGMWADICQKTRGQLRVGDKVYLDSKMTLADAWILRVDETDTCLFTDTGVYYAMETALAAVTSQKTKYEHLLSDKVFGQCVWLGYTDANKTLTDLTGSHGELDLDGTERIKYKDMEHALLCTVWKCSNDLMLVSWSLIAPLVMHRPGDIGCWTRDVTWDNIESCCLGDSFCGPLISSQVCAQHQVQQFPYVPVAWQARYGHASHSAQLWLVEE